MQKYHFWLLVTFINVQAIANQPVSPVENLADTNQRILDVFKGTEFDIDETDSTNQTPKLMPLVSPSSVSSFANNHLSSQFKLERPDSIWNSLDPFMFKELLDSCSQTLLNDIHNTIYLDSNTNIKHVSPKDRFTKLLLVGPQGSGKSSLSLAIAAALNRPYVFVSAASLANEYKNSAITGINNLFDPLIESGIATVVILDEITAFTKRFDNKNDSDPGAVEHLWVKLDACKQNPNLLVIFTANSTDAIPDTIKDRLSACEFHINHPDTNARKRILKHYLSEHCLLTDTFYDTLATKTKGFSLRELNMLIARAKNKALNRTIRKTNTDNSLEVQQTDIENAFKMLKISHDTEIKRKNKEYYKEVFSAVSPHIIPLASMLISTYLQVKFHNQQMEFTKHTHEQSMQHQRLVHWDTMAHMIENAERQHEFAQYSQEETMQHQRLVHWDTMAHMIENTERQSAFQTKEAAEQKLREEKRYQEEKGINEKRYKEGVTTNEKYNQEATKRTMYQNAGATVASAIAVGTGGNPLGVAAGAVTGLTISNIPEMQKNKAAQIICREIKNASWKGWLKFGFMPFYAPYLVVKTGLLLNREGAI